MLSQLLEQRRVTELALQGEDLLSLLLRYSVSPSQFSFFVVSDDHYNGKVRFLVGEDQTALIIVPSVLDCKINHCVAAWKLGLSDSFMQPNKGSLLSGGYATITPEGIEYFSGAIGIPATEEQVFKAAVGSGTVMVAVMKEM